MAPRPAAVPAPAREYALVESCLAEYKALTMSAMMEAIPRQEPRRYLYDLVPLYPLRPGKGFRPGLLLASCGAFGGTAASAIHSAVAIELFHNAFLVHDDVEDGSLSRRGFPTLSAEQGLALAVNVGDAMNVLSIEPLMRNLRVLGPQLTWQVFVEIQHMVRQSVEGQAMELGWVRDNVVDLTDADYLRMTLKKTCWYTCIHPCRIGALIGSRGAIDLDRFNRFGYYMGAAFQIQDDILNLMADERKYGKEIDGDIWEGKRTLMLIHVYGSATPAERERVERFLARPRGERRERDVRWVHALMDKYGSLPHATARAHELAVAALDEFEEAYRDAPDTREKRFIEEIVLYMVERDL
ncbi:MAG TPA: polyprenyl synthetase family protein [Gemmatimonadaceae bacterium]|jgi:geranylgeranyl diphosphate synthase type II